MTHKSIAITVVLLAIVVLLLVSQSTAREAVAQDPPTATPTPTATITPTSTPTIVPAVYIYSDRDGWINSWPLAVGDGKWCDQSGCHDYNMPLCYRSYYSGRSQAPLANARDMTGVFDINLGWLNHENIVLCNFTDRKQYYNLVASGSATGWSNGFQYNVDHNQPQARWFAPYSPIVNYCAATGTLQGLVCAEPGGGWNFVCFDTGGKSTNTQMVLVAPEWGCGPPATIRMFAGSVCWFACPCDAFFSYALDPVGSAQSTVIAATEVASWPTATPTATSTPVATPPIYRGAIFESMEGTPEYQPVLILGVDATLVATQTPTRVPTETPTATTTATVTPTPLVSATPIHVFDPNLPAWCYTETSGGEPTPPPLTTPVLCIIPTVLPASGGATLPDQDTTIGAERPTMNFGAISNLILAPNHTVLMRFGLAKYHGKRVTNATLRLFFLSEIDPAVPVIGGKQKFFVVYPVLPTTVTGKPDRYTTWVELQSTWQYRIPDTDWQIPGARGATDIRTDLPSGYVNVALGFVDTPLWLPLVQNWLDAPEENYGIAILNATAAIEAQMTSREWYQDGYRPQLILDLEG